MNAVKSFFNRHREVSLLALAFALVLVPTAVFAQSILSETGAAESMLTVVRPIFKLAQFVIVIVAFVLALVNAFKASRGGDSKGWITALVLMVVAALVAVPAMILGMLGMTDVAKCVETLTANKPVTQCVIFK
jgi:hypothetical protein